MRSTTDVILLARDLTAVKAHYHGRLGFPIVCENERLIGFDTGTITFYFEQGEPGHQVFDFAVDDLARAKATLLDTGCELVEENPAIPRVYMRDPFGLVFNIDQR